MLKRGRILGWLLFTAGACAVVGLTPRPVRSQTVGMDSRLSALESRVTYLEQRLQALTEPKPATPPPQVPSASVPPPSPSGAETAARVTGVAAFPLPGETAAQPCDPPFYMDQNGIRRDKPECVRKPQEDCSRTFITGSHRAIRRCLEDTPNPYR